MPERLGRHEREVGLAEELARHEDGVGAPLGQHGLGLLRRRDEADGGRRHAGLAPHRLGEVDLVARPQRDLLLRGEAAAAAVDEVDAGVPEQRGEPHALGERPPALAEVSCRDAAQQRQLGRPRGAHGGHDAQREARAVLEGPAVVVLAAVGQRRQELVQQVAVRRVQLDGAEARGERAARRGSEGRLDRVEVRRRNFIKAHEFPWLIPSGTRYDSGDYHAVVDKVLARVGYESLLAERDRLRASGMLAGIGIAACLEPSGGNSSFEPLLNETNTTSTWMESCRVNIDALGTITATIHTTSSGQGHETLAATVIGEVLEIEPDRIRVMRPDSLSSLPGNSPVGSRMAIMLGGAAFHAARKLREKLIAIAAHNLGCAPDAIAYAGGAASHGDGKLSWMDLVTIGHRHFHQLPEGFEPGLESTHVMQVPTGTELPKDGRVQMYPCHSFEFHVVLCVIDPELGKPELRRYVIGHDCGTVINPHIVKGMTLGGIAHGIGAALMEEFVYDESGQMMSQSFMDYLLPSSHEIPHVEIVHHCTPSPLTVFGQKGSGESGYLGAPAAVSGAVNDALRPLGVSFSKLPIRISAIGDAIAAAQAQEGK